MINPISPDRGDLWVRSHGPYFRGYVYSGHRHWVDHYSFVHEGTTLIVRYRYVKNGPVVKQTLYHGPCRFLVAAGLFHEIEIGSEMGYWDCEFVKPDEDSPLLNVYTRELDE
jgi:hypothetical protein